MCPEWQYLCEAVQLYVPCDTQVHCLYFPWKKSNDSSISQTVRGWTSTRAHQHANEFTTGINEQMVRFFLDFGNRMKFIHLFWHVEENGWFRKLLSVCKVNDRLTLKMVNDVQSDCKIRRLIASEPNPHFVSINIMILLRYFGIAGNHWDGVKVLPFHWKTLNLN